MSAREIDQLVTSTTPTPAPDADPFGRLFIDRTTRGGFRLVAVAEPARHDLQGYLIAAAALAAFEETAVVAINNDPEAGLLRAFGAAHACVQANNRSELPRQRNYAGITAAVIKDGEATIGLVPPGQALLIQDGRVYGVPDLATWRPSYMPDPAADASEPLGLSDSVKPVLRKTRVGRLDQLLVGSSAVGRVLAEQELTAVADLTATAVLSNLNLGLANAKIDDAFAALVTFDSGSHREPVTDAATEARLREIERVWRGENPQLTGVQHVQPVNEMQRRAIRRNDLHDRMIEWTERVLGRDDTEPLPLDRGPRASAAVGAGSLDRYTPERFQLLNAVGRSVLPLGLRLPISRRALSFLLVLVVAAASLSMAYGVQQARADRQTKRVNSFSTELALGMEAEAVSEADAHFANAERALEAAGSDIEPAKLAGWRASLVAARDERHGVTRLTGFAKIGDLPPVVNGEAARLLIVGGNTYLVAGSIFQIDASGERLVSVLEPGTELGGRTVGTLIDATVDGDMLVATDGRALYMLDQRGRWSVEKLADSGAPGGWRGAACGAYQGHFYLLDPNTGQIKKFESGDYRSTPISWLATAAARDVEGAVDMVVDGHIHVLTRDGEIHSFFQGKAEDAQHQFSTEPDATPVALFGGLGVDFLYILERDDNTARLIKYDKSQKTSRLFLAPENGSADYERAATKAFNGARDIVVDETTGAVYFVTGDGLWIAHLPQ